MKIVREVNPPPIIYSGKAEHIQLGVVQAMRFRHGFLIECSPEPIVAFFQSPLRESQRSTRISTISRLVGSRKVPNSDATIVIADWINISPFGVWNTF